MNEEFQEADSFDEFQSAPPSSSTQLTMSNLLSTDDDDLLGGFRMNHTLSSHKNSLGQPSHIGYKAPSLHENNIPVRSSTFPLAHESNISDPELARGAKPSILKNLRTQEPLIEGAPGSSDTGEVIGKQSLQSPLVSAPVTTSATASPVRKSSRDVRLQGVKPGITPIVTEELSSAIRMHLPTRAKISSKWSLVYSLDQDGAALSTLYVKCKAMTQNSSSSFKHPMILVIKSTRNEIFGAFLNEEFRESSSYYGDSTSFLWRGIPFGPDDMRMGFQVVPYKWTGKNNYIILSDAKYLSVGGGNGKYGLWIDSVLDHGVTGACPCFNNEPLVSDRSGDDWGKFRILSLELWEIVQ